MTSEEVVGSLTYYKVDKENEVNRKTTKSISLKYDDSTEEEFPSTDEEDMDEVARKFLQSKSFKGRMNYKKHDGLNRSKHCLKVK